MKTRLTNKTFGLLFLGSGLLVTSLLVSCTVNAKHSDGKTAQETGKPKKEEPKSSQATDKTTDVVYKSEVIEKDTPKKEDFEKKVSVGDKLDTTNRLLSEIKEIIEMKAAKGLL